MPTVSFCPKCGAAVKPEFEFCTSCGFALAVAKEGGTAATPPQQPVPEQQSAVPATPVTPIPTIQAAAVTQPVKPGSAAAPLFSRQVHILIIALLLAGTGAWIWSIENGKNKDQKSMDNLLNKPDKEWVDEGSLSILDNKNSTRIQSDDFAGTWRAYETNKPEMQEGELGNPDNDIFIEVSNGSFSIYPRMEKGKEHSADFTCGEVSGNRISCNGYSKEDGESFNLLLELGETKDQLTMSMTGLQNNENVTIKLRRL